MMAITQSRKERIERYENYIIMERGYIITLSGTKMEFICCL